MGHQSHPEAGSMGMHQRRSGQMPGTLFVLNVRKLLAPHFGGSSLHPTNNKTWKFLENKFPRVKWLLLRHKVNAAKIPF